jgi:hypothetical protein
VTSSRGDLAARRSFRRSAGIRIRRNADGPKGAERIAACWADRHKISQIVFTKMCTPVVAMGGEKGLGAKVGQGVSLVAENVEAHTLTDCGHFLPEERPYEIVEQIVAMARRRSTS